MNQFEIRTALTGRLKLEYLTHPIKYNVGNGFDSKDSPYIELFIKPNKSDREIGGFKNQGFFTVLLWYPKSNGALWGEETAQEIADLFPDGLILEDIEIMGKPDVKGFVDNRDGWWFTPVSIEYENVECVA